MDGPHLLGILVVGALSIGVGITAYALTAAVIVAIERIKK